MAKKALQFDKTVDQVIGQVDRMLDLANLSQKQAEKMVTLWLDQSFEVLKAGHEMTKEWLEIGNKMSVEFSVAFENSVKEATKVFAPAA